MKRIAQALLIVLVLLLVASEPAIARGQGTMVEVVAWGQWTTPETAWAAVTRSPRPGLYCMVAPITMCSGVAPTGGLICLVCAEVTSP